MEECNGSGPEECNGNEAPVKLKLLTLVAFRNRVMSGHDVVS